MLCNTAIFYDIENLLGVFSGKAVLNLDEIYRRVLESEGVHGVSIQRAYADWALQPNRALRDSVLQVGIEPIQIFNTNQNDRVKNAADVSLIIDAVELIAKRPEIENYVIASGDGIFAFLSKKLHEHGKRVIGCGFDRNASALFCNSCDYFISLEKSDKALVATSTARRKNRKADPVPTQAEEAAPVAAKVPSKFPKTKYSEVLAQANIPIWRDPYDLSGSLHTIRKVVDALLAEETEGLPDLEISVFKTYVDHYIPGFRVSRYGFTRFGEFMRFVLTGSSYCLYTIDESVCKIARRGAAIKNGTIMDDVKGLVVTAEDGSRFGSIFSVPVDMAFIFTVLSDSAPQVKNGRRKKPAPEVAPAPKLKNKKHGRKSSQIANEAAQPAPVVVSEPPASEPEIDIVMDEGSFRKWIKNRFQSLSDSDVLSAKETNLLISPDYSRRTFGIKTPILREIETRSNLLEQRSINGKVKYWKETFKYNGKHYLVYKDWVASLHKDRYVAWLRTLGPEALGEK